MNWIKRILIYLRFEEKAHIAGLKCCATQNPMLGLAETPISEYEREIAAIMSRGMALDAEMARNAKKRIECNHRKGGHLSEDGTTFPLIGNSDNYAVMKHVMANGDMRVACTRCNRVWNHPVRKDYATFDQYALAMAEYQKAVDFPTNNITSSGVQFNFRHRLGDSYAQEIVRNALPRE